jgi:hypothetical protein
MAGSKFSSVRFPSVELFTGFDGPAAFVGGRPKGPADVVTVNGTTPILVCDMLWLWAKEPERTAIEAERAEAYLRAHPLVASIRRRA